MATATCLQPLHSTELTKSAKTAANGGHPHARAARASCDGHERRSNGWAQQQSYHRQKTRTQDQASSPATHTTPRTGKRRYQRQEVRGAADTSNEQQHHQPSPHRSRRPNNGGHRRGGRSNNSNRQAQLQDHTAPGPTMRAASNSGIFVTSSQQETPSHCNSEPPVKQQVFTPESANQPTASSFCTTVLDRAHSSLDSGRGTSDLITTDEMFSTNECHTNTIEEDDVFMDALSNLNSADSSLSSSAFVTPSGSHPSSPPSSPCSSQSTCLSVELLTSSCNRLLQLQQEEEAENGGMTPPSLTESDQHDSGLEENATADVDDLGSVSRRRKDEIASTPTESSTVTSGEDKNKDSPDSTRHKLPHQPAALDYPYSRSDTRPLSEHALSLPTTIVTIAPHSPQSSFSSSFSPQSSFSTTQSISELSTPLTSPSPSPQPENHTPTAPAVDLLQEKRTEEKIETEDKNLKNDVDESNKLFHLPNSAESSPPNHSSSPNHFKSEEEMSPPLVMDLAAELPTKLAQLLHSVSLPELPPLSPSLPTSPAAALPYEVIHVAQLEAEDTSPLHVHPHPPPSLAPHPLNHTWVMWYDRITTGRPQFENYVASLNKLCAVKSIEDFWGVYNNIKNPSELDKNSNYHFFKKGIRPLWEDKANKHGGKWVLTVRNNVTLLDQLWLELLMALVGEQVEYPHLITGAVVSRRKKGDRIALWTQSKKNKEGNLRICKKVLRIIAQVLEVKGDDKFSKMVEELAVERDGMSLVYMHHNDALRSGTSYQNEARLSLRDNLKYMLSSTRRQ